MLCDTHRHLALTNSDCPGCLQARVAELEGGLSRMREAADHPHFNSIEKLATIGTILATLN